MKTLNFLHSGKCGDCIASLAAVKQICECSNAKARIFLDCTGTAWRVNNNERLKLQVRGKPMPFSRAACEYIKPLIEHQGYVEEVTIADAEYELPHIDYDLNMMRALFFDIIACKSTGTNLELLYKAAFKLPIMQSAPWLEAPKGIGREWCIARSTRYQSAHLWLDCKMSAISKGWFLGTDFEHAVFEDAFDCKIDHNKSKDALESASIIAASKHFFAPGNVHYWIAVGLGHPDIYNEFCPDVFTTVYKGKSNITYVLGGKAFKT